ncbi:O-antigen ligase family protein [Faecalicatena contorta]|uniref:O-antigen ligase family protein n=1 Tax=Faecalicatena contorta TaxID=39482 RepID=UPI001F2A3604|nr:O-antigen ligase family protein [Faecalicatena contorta]MCF2680722.1 O-antigen ligase family protein [Faecalicatena contorta]
MKYVITFVIGLALMPGLGVNINLGLFYITPLRLALIFLPIVYIGERLVFKEEGYYLKQENLFSIVFMIIWFLYSIVTLFWCKDVDAWSHGLYFIGIGIWSVLWFDMSDLKMKDYFFVLKGVYVVIILHNIIGWSEIVTHNYMFAPIERIISMQQNKQFFPISMMLNQNDFAMVLIFGACLSIFFIIVAEGYVFKIFCFAVFISNSCLIVLTDSRLGIVGFGIAIIIIAYVIIPRKYKKILICLGIVLIITSVLLFPKEYVNLVAQIRGIEIKRSGNPLVDSDAVRVNLLKNGLYFLKETFGFGVGLGNVEYWMQNEALYYVRGFVNMHNWWMEILAAFGIGIFVLYVVFYLNLFLSFKKKNKISNDKRVKMLSVTFLGFLGAFSVASISSSSNWGKEWLWIIWAFMIAYEGYSEKRDI